MDFNFYIKTGDDKQEENKDLEDILKDIETHFEDWNNFYNLYQMFAPPPTDNSKQIQAWFKELQASFFKIIKKYNESIHQFADIQEIQEDDIQNMMKKAMVESKDATKTSKKKKDSDDDISMMYS